MSTEREQATWGDDEVEAHHRGHNLNTNEDAAEDEQEGEDADDD
jgi:hypothetical protein